MNSIFREPMINRIRRHGKRSNSLVMVSRAKVYRLLRLCAPSNDGIDQSILRENRCGVVSMFTILLASCGGGTVESGGAFDATTGEIAGIYMGSENLSLTAVNDAAVVDTRRNSLTITVSGQGAMVLSSENGSTGQAQVTNDRTFRMRADARTHFSGRCSAGVIVLEGHIDAETGITARYRSDGLTCAGEPHVLDGRISAQRM